MTDPTGFVNPYQNPTGLFHTQAPAVLYLFSPRPFGAQVRRPIIYNFTDRFTNAASELIHDGAGLGAQKIQRMLNDPLSYDVVLPGDAPDSITRIDQLGDYWTFLLVVNGEQPHYRMNATGFEDTAIHSSLSNRLKANRGIYYGYFLEEPLNPRTLGGTTPTINPHARMTITHKTFINQMSGFGPNGLTTPRYDVITNSDVVDPSVLSMITSQPMHRITPDSLLESVEHITDPDTGQQLRADMFGYGSEINPHQPSFGLRADLSEPRENLKQIVNGMAAVSDSIFSQSRMGTMSAPYVDNLTEFGNHDLITSGLIDRFKHRGVGDGIGLRENDVITMEFLVTRYNPEIVPFIIERHNYWETMDQTIRSAANTWSSLLTQAGPVLLTNAGLAEVTLEYDSAYDALQIHTVSHMASVAEAEKQGSVRAFMYELKSRLFSMMKAARGDFRVQLTLQSAGVSKCILNFYADDAVNSAPFETPTIAGGLTSNLLGTVDTAAFNGQSLVAFTDHVFGAELDRSSHHSPTPLNPPVQPPAPAPYGGGHPVQGQDPLTLYDK